MIKFTIPGKPQGKLRARTFYNPRMKRMQTYTPEKTVAYENLIKICFKKVMPKGYRPIEDGVHIEIYAYHKKSRSNTMIHPCIKVDIDNLIKVVCDALNGIAYKDDKQVVSLVCQKLWSQDDHSERVEVIIQKMEGYHEKKS